MEDVIAVLMGFASSIAMMITFDVLIDTALVAAVSAIIGGGLAWCVKEGLNDLKKKYKNRKKK